MPPDALQGLVPMGWWHAAAGQAITWRQEGVNHGG
jgi:hypothetical protein